MGTILASNALTTLDRINLDLGITVPSDIWTQPEVDNETEAFINAASDFIERECGRSFQKATVTSEMVAGMGTDKLIVARTPLVSITSITYDSEALDATSYEIHDAEAGIIRREGTPWSWTVETFANISGDPAVGTERKLYAVTYVGGYVLPNDVGTRTLPYDLEVACRQLVAMWYRMKGADPRIKSESLLSWSASYSDATIPPMVASVIAKYRRI